MTDNKVIRLNPRTLEQKISVVVTVSNSSVLVCFLGCMNTGSIYLGDEKKTRLDK